MNLQPPEKLEEEIIESILFPDQPSIKELSREALKINQLITFSHELVEYLESKEKPSYGCIVPSPESEVDVTSLLTEYAEIHAMFWQCDSEQAGDESLGKRMSEIEEIINRAIHKN
jgi:predicted ribosome quality control (RQC) complex YloA/Tae2 family protein